MNQEHWTSDQLIAYIYGLRPEDSHLVSCEDCRSRLQAFQHSRATVEEDWSADDSVASDLLAAQRRRIYQAIDKPQRWWSLAARPQWASAALVVALLAGGATLVEQKYLSTPSAPTHHAPSTVSDSQLADDVSSIAESSEPSAAAPLQGLFED